MGGRSPNAWYLPRVGAPILTDPSIQGPLSDPLLVENLSADKTFIEDF